MPATKQLIIYASGSKIIRRIIVDDNDRLDPAKHVGPGEAALIVDRPTRKGEYPDLGWCRTQVEAETGEKSPDGRCAVVDPGDRVVRMILADPALDSLEGYTLVRAYDGVFKGCTYDQAKDEFIAPARTIEPFTDFGVFHPEETVEARAISKPTEEVAEESPTRTP